ncbi:glycine--tRNA ligase [Candidatus Pacearchaeota archaeon]|nr:glycine--tRNA ligase [Candidatus Pacearchaeota archaeon]
MVFIVKKKIHGNDYFYLRESKRVGVKVKSIDLGYLGKTREEAEKKLKERLKKEVAQEINMKKSILELTRINIEELAKFCKRKGFVYPSAEIYGGAAGFWDFGHLGVELNNNLKQSWWSFHVRQREDVVGIDGSIITNPKVWKASGHVDSFSDVFVVCKKCKKPGKVDKDELGKVKCPACGGDFDETTAKEFKLMFKTEVGLDGHGYLRPETAQLIFTNFKFVQENARMKLPFGIAQIGKAFRNEIAPRDFLFRGREFEQMELQYFIDPDKVDDCPYYNKIKNKKIKILTSKAQTEDNKEKILTLDEMLNKGIFRNKWHAYWLYNSYQWFLELGLNVDNLRLREHRKDELAHYAKAAVDIEYKFNLEWRELFGSHDRGQFDLGEHEKFSKKDLKVYDEESKNRILPRVIEASFGVGRAYLAFMLDSYYSDSEKGNVVLKLSPKLSPIKAAIFPIVKRPEFESIAEEILKDLGEEWNVVYDKSGSIGRRYARNDEIGTPFCITIDEQSLKKKDVTIRDRDTTKQIRVKIFELKEVLRKLINKKLKFEDAGKLIK